jgi:RNA polymerase sigma-70 factor (ECF subfamily)
MNASMTDTLVADASGRNGRLDSTELYRAHVHDVARWARRLAGPRLDVEDLVQEIFMRVHQSLPSFRGEARVTTWLYGITHNVVCSRRRRERLRRFFGAPAEQPEIEAVPGPATPLELIERSQSVQLVYAALDGMADKYRSVLILFELEGLSGEEIAALTGLKVATVWVRLSRARAQLLERVATLEGKEQHGRPR